ncbi:MAG: DNA double-strand break repair nuclease NurA [Candidatus Thermoplasmatota archaeon]|nr:DNA double-strand break repair nuclease NurA [Candidatus Thermoplasmatota archaeon]
MIEVKDPFEELPEGLVEEMLARSNTISQDLLQKFKEITDRKDILRKNLEKDGLLKNYNEMDGFNTYPTSAGVDGSYSIERMLSLDFACVAAVAVEGLTPPGPEKRNWPKPRYFSHVESIRHNEDTSQVLRGISAGLELHLIVNAPHDVIMLDGSMKTPLIFINNAAEKLETIPDTLKEVFLNGKDSKNEDQVRFPGFIDIISDYYEILKSERTDKIYAAVPKYTTRNDLSSKFGLPEFEDRGLLNFILKGGEYVGPYESEELESPHLSFVYFPSEYDISSELREKVKKITEELLPNISTIYFRPNAYSPVLRIEVSKSVSKNKSRLRTLMEAIQIQTTSLSIMEPYPLYLADRMVKHLSTAIPAIRKASFQNISENWSGDISNVYMGMHGYRTESG